MLELSKTTEYYLDGTKDTNIFIGMESLKDNKDMILFIENKFGMRCSKRSWNTNKKLISKRINILH